MREWERVVVQHIAMALLRLVSGDSKACRSYLQDATAVIECRCSSCGRVFVEGEK